MNFELLNILIKAGQYKCNVYYQNEIIKSTGACSTKIYFIKDGVMKIGCFTDQGEDIVLIVLTKNQIFGASSIFIDFYSYYMYESLSKETTVYEFDKSIIQKSIKENQNLYKDFLSILGKEYQEYENRIKTLQIQSAELRLVRALFEFKEKFGYTYHNSGKVIINCPINQNELSNYIRVSRVTINTLINKLTNDYVLEYKNRTIILNKSFFDNYRSH